MSELISTLDPTILVSLIGFLSLVLSAGIGAIVSRWHTASKFREELQEVRLALLDEQSESYLKNAREQIETVYVPLNSELAVLKTSFQTYVYQGKTDENRQIFIEHIDKFVENLQALEMRGATAYITADLEDLLIKFVVFLRSSKSATKSIFNVTYNFNAGFGVLKTQRISTIQGTLSKAVSKLPASISVAGIGADVRISDVIKAPINSDDFQARFERDSFLLSVLIKEVTLGRAARES